jgi:hypothetical protein
MARDYAVKVGDEHYRGTTASAKAQFEALHIAMRTALVSIIDGRDHSEMGLVTFMGGVDFGELERLEDLLLKNQLVRDSDDAPVGRNLFGDAPQEYYLLLFHVIRENLEGFWNLRRPTSAAAAEKQTS